MSKRAAKLSDQLRQAIDPCGMSHNAIARATGIDKSFLSRFVNRKSSLSLASADRLAALLKLRLIMDGPDRPK